MKKYCFAVIGALLGGVFAIAGADAQGIVSLEDCIAIALQNNSLYKISQSRVGQAEAGVLNAYSQILPRLEGSAGGNENRIGPQTAETSNPVFRRDQDGQIVYDEFGAPIIDKYVKRITLTDPRLSDSYRASVNANMLIYDGGGWWNRIKESGRTRDAREFDEKAQRISTVTDVKRFYYELLRNQNLLVVRDEDVRLAEEQLKSAQSRYEIGVAAQIDVYTSRVSYNESRINYFNQERQVEIAKANLNNILGRDPFEQIIISEDSTLTEIEFSMDEALEKALGGHPQIKSREEEIESAKYAYKAAKSGLLPTISASLSYSRFNPKFERVYSFIDRNYSWGYSVNMSIPFFDGLQTKSQISQAEHSRDIAEENLIDSKRQVTRDVREYYITHQSYVREVAMRNENLVEAEENLRLARERYNVGAGTLLEVIDAQVRLTNARTQRVSAVYDAKIAEAQLAGALGVQSLEEL